MTKKSPKVSQLNVGLKLEKQLKEEIFDFLQYDAVSVVMNNVGYWEESVTEIARSIFKHSVRVSDKLMKPLHDMLLLAKARLGFDEPIDLYVVNKDVVNACASLSFNVNCAHVIQVNAGLINGLNDEEILSVIGHEIGHLIGRDAEVYRLMSFIYGENRDKEVPRFLNAKLQMLSQLQEIRCDRCGCIASGKLEPNVTSQFSLMCGVNYNRFGGDVQGLLARCTENVELIKSGQIPMFNTSHPEDPIRIKAMEIFCKNDDKKQLEKEMEEIVDLINLWHADEMDKHYVEFLVSAGLMVANRDGNITKEEMNAIVNNVVNYKLFPVKEFEKIAKKDIEKVFRRSVNAILEKEMFKQDYLMKYILRIMVADQHIGADELQFAFRISQDVFGMPVEMFSNCYAQVIQEFFNPRYRL